MKYKVFLSILLIVFIIGCLYAQTSLVSTDKGVWIWKVWEVENGDLNKILNTLESAGVSWVVIKCGDSDSYYLEPGKLLYNWATAYGGFRNVIAQFHNSGIKVFGWHFVYSYDQWGISGVSESDVSNMILDISGIDGLVINAETAYEGQGKGAIAEQYMISIRQRHPMSFVTYSSFGRVTGHEWLPWLQFGRYSDANMPQAYWAARPLTPEEEVNSMKSDFDYWHNVWAQGGFGDSIKPIVPVGQGGNLEIGNPIYPGEIIRFCDAVHSYGYQGISLYAYHIMNQASWDEYSFCWTDSLSVSLTATPSNGTAPLNVNLTADVTSSTTNETINYTFWWKCNDPGISVTNVVGFGMIQR